MFTSITNPLLAKGGRMLFRGIIRTAYFAIGILAILGMTASPTAYVNTAVVIWALVAGATVAWVWFKPKSPFDSLKYGREDFFDTNLREIFVLALGLIAGCVLWHLAPHEPSILSAVVWSLGVWVGAAVCLVVCCFLGFFVAQHLVRATDRDESY